MGHELYCAGHLIQAGIAAAADWLAAPPRGRPRAVADLLVDVFGSDADRRTDGHPEVEVALVELYRETADRRYLALADKLTSRRGFGFFAGGRFDLPYYQDAEPVRGSRSIVGHAVRALYLAAGVTDLYAETGDETLLEAMLSQWDDLVSTKAYLTGGVGSRHYGEAIGDPYELPPDRAYCETCASIASIMWNWRLLLVTGESRFADLIERTLYNGFLAGPSLDGRSFFYANPLQSRGGHTRHAWNPVACCPPNIMRLLASLHHYLATTSDGGVQLHQYATSTIRAVVPGAGPVELAVETGYPWSGSVTVEVVACGDAEWTLSLRVPAWARGAVVDGQPVAPGYAELTRRWRAGDRVVLELDVSPRLTAPNPRIDAVRGCVALERGPVVYCFETDDLPAGADLADIALQTDSGACRQRSADGARRRAGRVRRGRRPRPRPVGADRVHRRSRAPAGRRGRTGAAARGPLLRVGEPRRRRDARLGPHLRLAGRGSVATLSLEQLTKVGRQDVAMVFRNYALRRRYQQRRAPVWLSSP